MSVLMRSKVGEIKTKEEWEKEVNEFWKFAELQNRYICNPRFASHKRQFKRPANAFERYAKLIGLETVA